QVMAVRHRRWITVGWACVLTVGLATAGQHAIWLADNGVWMISPAEYGAMTNHTWIVWLQATCLIVGLGFIFTRKIVIHRAGRPTTTLNETLTVPKTLDLLFIVASAAWLVESIARIELWGSGLPYAVSNHLLHPL